MLNFSTEVLRVTQYWFSESVLTKLCITGMGGSETVCARRDELASVFCRQRVLASHEKLSSPTHLEKEGI